MHTKEKPEEPEKPRKNPQHAATGQISDLQFLSEIPDEPSAEAWFMVAWGQAGDFPHCPRCEKSGKEIRFDARKSKRLFWCKGCRKPFSMKLDTLMCGSRLGLQKWAHLLHVWTGGDGPSSADELERRSGLGVQTGDDVNKRLLCAAKEEVARLDEDCVLWWFQLGKAPSSQAHVVVLKGCVTRRTVLDILPAPPGRDRQSFRNFVDRNLQDGHCLFLDKPNLASDLRKVTPRSLSEMGDPSLSRTSLEALQERVKAIVNDVYHGVRTKNLDRYLAGIQWWENYGQLSHRERARKLAQQMRHKTVPRLKGSNKRSRRRQNERQVYQWKEQERG